MNSRKDFLIFQKKEILPQRIDSVDGADKLHPRVIKLLENTEDYGMIKKALTSRLGGVVGYHASLTH